MTCVSRAFQFYEPVIYLCPKRIHCAKIIDHGVPNQVVKVCYPRVLLQEISITAPFEQIVYGGQVLGLVLIKRDSAYINGL